MSSKLMILNDVTDFLSPFEQQLCHQQTQTMA